MKIIIHPGNEAYHVDFDYTKYPAIFEAADDLIEFDRLLLIDNNYYSLASMNSKKGFCLVEKVKTVNFTGEDKRFESEIICPYCSQPVTGSWEYSDSESDYKCSCCGGIFSYEREVEVTYSTTPLKKPEYINLEEE